MLSLVDDDHTGSVLRSSEAGGLGQAVASWSCELSPNCLQPVQPIARRLGMLSDAGASTRNPGAEQGHSLLPVYWSLDPVVYQPPEGGTGRCSILRGSRRDWEQVPELDP